MRNEQLGFTLIELMLVLFLSATLFAASAHLVQRSFIVNQIGHSQIRIQEAARIAKQFLERDIKRAGYNFIIDEFQEVGGTLFIPEPVGQCDETHEAFTYALYPKIQGANNSSQHFKCLRKVVKNTDILVLRYLNPVKSVSSKKSNQDKIYLRSSLTDARAFRAKDKGHFRNQMSTPFFTFEKRVLIYYVRETQRYCHGKLVSALYREYLGDKGYLLAEEIVSGVEQFQIRYLVDDKLLNASMISNEEWNRVMALSISILVRSECSINVDERTNQFQLEDYHYVPEDTQYLRKQFQFNISMRN